jgi:ParB family chromosome partitioning protein
VSESFAQGKTFQRIRVVDVTRDELNPRKSYPPEELQALADDLRDRGPTHAVNVWLDISTMKYVIWDGERRWRAAQEAGLEELDCLVGPRPADEVRRRVQLMRGNEHRKDVPPLELAQGLKELADVAGWTGSEVAEALNWSDSKVSRLLGLLKLPPEVRQRLASGQVSARQLRPGPKSKRDQLKKPFTVGDFKVKLEVTPKPELDALGELLEEITRRIRNDGRAASKRRAA